MTETDSEFETFLRRRTVLPNGMSDDDKLEPPKALDAIVLNKAREAIRAQERVNRAPRWARPVAIAATILLCLSIVLNVSLNRNRPTANLRRMTAATADKASPTPAAPVSGNERREGAVEGTISHEAILPEAKVAESYAPRSPVLAEAAKPAPDDSLRANSHTADRTDALANRGGTPMPASSEAPPAANSAEKATRLADRSGAPGQAPTEAPATAAREAVASSASGAVTNAPSRSAAAPATPTPSVMASAAPPPPAPAPAMPSSSAGVPADQFTSVTVTGARRSRADERTAASYPSTSGTAPSAAAAASPAADSDAAASGLEGASHATPGRSREGRPGPTLSGRMPALEETVVTSRKAAAPHPQNPKIWLQQIAALRAEGKSAQADAEMRRFRAIFPAYPAKPGPSTPSEPPK
jgi:hypothetical protein